MTYFDEPNASVPCKVFKFPFKFSINSQRKLTVYSHMVLALGRYLSILVKVLYYNGFNSPVFASHIVTHISGNF